MTWRKEETRGEFFLQKSTKSKPKEEHKRLDATVALTLSLQYV
jgi:hypothetical protein